MTDLESLEIETVVRLLSKTPHATRPARYEDCTAIVARHLKDGSEFLFALIKAAIEAGIHQTSLIDDVISFLDDTHLARLAFFLQAEVKRGTDVEDLLAQVALQAPELFPLSTLSDIPDFADWLTHDDPRSPSACHHFIFEEGAPSDIPTHRNHPTWHLPAAEQSFSVGGEGTAICPTCRNKLVHLVTLDDLGGKRGTLPRLHIETCANSLELTYYFHDAAGMPTPIAPFHSAYDFTSEPTMQKSIVRLASTPPRWLRQSYGLSNSRQNLFRLGGLPSWVQGPQFPLVPGTDREMQFLLQFDSLAGFFWGSGGMLYVFWDEESQITCHVPQYT
ncbi:hypothetical protein [Mesorhizobium sp.]|uniref:hypothetical protein n=1 Tax=Mesorhizobium sp. TaxID=1871066 RepID=UPI000FE9C5F0|nr:hypothetical protein [Mesorhizobium sp.]RWC54859.1 MAG: hypothetical protein EOS56_27845 [Mesorhizobium sp.]RWC55719.1 MAG: hypothetical protein EOS29_26915 [Mesorhizobium sp.]